MTCPHPHSESVAKVRQEGRSPDPGALCVFPLVCVCVCVCVCLCVCYLLSHVRLGWEFSSKSTGVGFHSLPQGITVCGSQYWLVREMNTEELNNLPRLHGKLLAESDEIIPTELSQAEAFCCHE